MDRHHYTATTVMTQNHHHHHYQQSTTTISNNVQRGRQVTSKDIAHAIDYFEHFLNATSLKNILGYYRSICELLNLKPNHFLLFYPKLKNYLTSWRAKALWKKFDARSIHKCYGKGKICTNTRILIIGAGPCGLRTAIEAQLLGAKVVVIEKRDRLSRNNVLHLWPFVIEDLRGLGAKKFFGKFCAGSIDHISIRQLQCVLLKVALLLGVEVHTEVSFERLIEPNPIEKTGWKAEFKPINHPVSQYEFDVIIGADGKRNTLQGFKRKEFRGKLAIAITANFINKRTEAEARVEEISGVAFIFNQKFFKDLYEDTGIDLENIVYYKDDTHYFVMTAKKTSLIDKGVIKQDLADTERLLAPDNVNREALMNYAREAANFSTNYQMPDLEFAVNHYGQPDVAMFDFTSMYAAENASKVVERHGYRLLMILVGDSLLEPFWPTGSGCARGFLSSLDAAWAIRSWSLGTMTPLEVIAERESIYRLLAQTTPDNLNKDWKAYTLDPTTRYPNLNKNVVIAHQVISLYDTDNPKAIEKMKRNSQDLLQVDVPKKRRRGNVDSEILVNWVSEQIREHEDIVLTDLASIFRNGKVLCAVINHYRPDLLDYNSIKDEDPIKNNQLAIDILEKEIGIPPIMTGEEITNTDDYLTMATYLTQVYDRFRGEIPHIKHPRLPQSPEFPLPPLPEKPPPSPLKASLPDLFELLKKRIDDQFYPFILADHCSQSERSDLKNVIENQKIDRKDADSSSSSVYSGKEIILKYEENNSKIVNEIDNSKKVNCERNDICAKIKQIKTEFYVKRKPIKFRGKLTLKMESIPEDIVNYKQNFVKASCSTNTRYNFSGNDRKLKSRSLTKSPLSVCEDFIVYPRRHVTLLKPNKKLSHFKSLNQIERRRNQADGDSYDLDNNNNNRDIELPPENKRNEPSFRILKHIPTTAVQQTEIPSTIPTMRTSSRHKRHADALTQTNNKGNSVERKTRKRRTLEKVNVGVEERQKTLEEIIANRNERQNKRKQQRRLQTEQFLKSMQMLQANAKPDASQPFEDYSIFLYRQTAPNFEDRVKDLEKKFTYVPDHENKLPNQRRGSNNTDEDLAARIKSLEDKWKEPVQTEKKPKDLLRAIGKIETSDWNIKEIEKKIRENKLGKPTTNKDKEKVPKWSKEQFLARQTKMEKQHLDRQDSNEAKFADIDRNIKHLELKLKEGTSRDLGQNKVATITEKLVSKIPENEAAKPIQKSQSRPAVVLPQGSEFCHFCGKRVYLMERLSAEGRFFHHGCFKCQYCHTQLRLGSYAFDRDGLYDHKFFCIHHYGMQGELKPNNKVVRKPSQKQQKSPEKKLGGISGVDLLDRVRTPERIEFANLNNQLSDQDESLSQMDEDEWTDKNFGASTAELGTSDEESSSLSDSESDDEDAYEEALEEPATKEGTLKWAERFNKRYSRKRSDSESDDYSSSDHSSYYENTSDDEDSETATEGEEEIRARELRKQEVRVEPPVVHTDTGTDTEVVSDESSTESSSEVRNSATEISTDSEFAHDDPTPTREIPPIVFNDFYVTKSRGSGNDHQHRHHPPKRIQVTSAYIQKRTNQGKTPSTAATTTTKTTTTVTTTNRDNIELNLTPLVPSTPSILRKPAPTPLRPTTEGYALNRTQSTGGIAAKVSLELKKKYLLGNETNPGGAIQKSGSASTLDTKLKSFHSNISDCQKLLRPASEISASMQTFCNKLNEKLSPILATTPSPINKIADNKELEIDQTEKEQEVYVFENELEGRPRSPLHETSIIVPKIDWNKNKSQSSDSLSENSSDNVDTKFKFKQIPKVQVDEIPPDSLTIIDEQQQQEQTETTSIPTNTEPLKSICSEKKMLNQPKQLPDIEIKEILPEIHSSLHIKQKENNQIIKSDNSTPQSDVEQQTAALTETELSDWARDGLVSNDDDDDYLDHVEFDQKTNKFLEKDYQHICGKDNSNKIIITETMNNILSKNLDNIEFMDTGTESSSDDDDDDDDDNGVDKNQNGYMLFKDDDDDDINDDSLNIIDTKNDDLISKNTGYCVIGDEKINRFGEVTDLKPEDLEKFKHNQQNNDINDDDSLLIIENTTIASGGTTEENTCSDSTVKNLTEIGPPVSPVDNNSFQKKRLEEKLAKLKAEQQLKQQQQQPEIISSHLLITAAATSTTGARSTTNENNVIFDQHCQRLQSKIEFGNAKDSIDIRKSRRKSKSESSPSSTATSNKPDLIQEEKSSPISTPLKQQADELKTTVRTPDVLYKKEFIEKERDDNQKLIQEMVMLKMKSENKSLERKKRRSNNRPFELTKSATTDIVTEINRNNLDLENSINSTPTTIYTTPPDVLLSTIKKSPTIAAVQHKEIYSTPLTRIDDENKENKNDIRKSLFNNNNDDGGGDFRTPIAPPRYKHEEAKRTAEKLRQDARLRAKFKSNEELGLSPEEKLQKLKEKLFKKDTRSDNGGNIEAIVVVKPERPNSWLYSNDTLNRKKNGSLRRTKSGDGDGTNSGGNNNNNNNGNYRTKSIPEILNDNDRIGKFYKSDPNLLLDGGGDGDCGGKKTKKKDREHRKSITKIFTTFFKKSPSSGSKNGGIFSKISPKSKDLSKDVLQEEPSAVRRSSLTELSSTSRRRCIDNSSPPPVPPLPLNYTGTSIRGTDDSSDGDHDLKRTDRSSCDTLDQSGILDTSSLSLTKRSKSARRAARQSQLKRHRMAQEIQRKLEETEVKTRELEERGVAVEKALRGEDAASGRLSREEPELLQEWFDLMRDRTELRRYEKELMVRAQELELEDRHARLQHELRERLENNDHKTEEDVVIEGQIINEMMEIVAKRDSLITLLEEDRLRYSTEDRDFEEQMLAKGLRLTPIRKTPEK